MNLHGSKIEWCTHTWNPVTGCLHGCTCCYARRLIDRFKPHPCERPGVEPLEVLPKGSGCYYLENPAQLYDETGAHVRPTPYPKGFSPTYHAYAMDYPAKRAIPSRVFVSSMGDLFGEWVPDIWIQDVFDACDKAPQHTYLFLTKNPHRYCDLANAGKLPGGDNYWYGTTITKPDDAFFWKKGVNTFLSIEPIVEPFPAGLVNWPVFPGWIIVGAMTGPGSKHHQPKREWVENIVEAAANVNVPVFLKDSLASIWGPDLIRQHPDGMVWPEDKKHC